jgi:predicted enzyme related to lactoylglutathione lyase
MTAMKNPFAWYELMTTDVPAAARFYGAVVGWRAEDSGMTGLDYILFHSGDSMVAGLMAQPEDSKAAGNPPGWLGYVGVGDVDAKTADAKRLGGAVHVEPRDIPGVGRFSVVADPQGAVFALFSGSGEEPPRPDMMTTGQVGWNELYASDWQAVLPFYEALFGWTKGTSVDMGGMGTYQLVIADGGTEAFGGMFDKPKEVPATFWLYYFAVDAIDPAAERVTANGGRILFGPMEVPGGAFIVQCQDPQGAMFALVGPRT